MGGWMDGWFRAAPYCGLVHGPVGFVRRLLHPDHPDQHVQRTAVHTREVELLDASGELNLIEQEGVAVAIVKSRGGIGRGSTPR